MPANLERLRSTTRSRASRRFFTMWKRSATCNAWGAPSVAPRVYSVERSRLMTSMPGCYCNHCARVSAVRSGSSSIGQCSSKSISMVP